MKTIAIMRLTFDPKDVGDLTLDAGKIKGGRAAIALNEGDIKAINLVKSLGSCEAISVGLLDAKSRVHTFVRGADEIHVFGDYPSRDYDEVTLANLLAEQIKAVGGVQVIALSPFEQDSGRGMLAGLLAAKLGCELFVNVKKVENQNGALLLEQQQELGVQQFSIKETVVICPDESCSMGDDPADAFDLIEKFEKKEVKKVPVNIASLSKKMEDGVFEVPPELVSQAAVALSSEVVQKVVALVKPFSN